MFLFREDWRVNRDKSVYQQYLHLTSFDMMTSSNGNICHVTAPLCVGEFSSQRPVTRSFDVFFHLCLNKRLSKQSWRGWFETPSRSWWCHCNGCQYTLSTHVVRPCLGHNAHCHRIKSWHRNILGVTGPLLGESTVHRRIPPVTSGFPAQKVSNVEMWCFRCLEKRLNEHWNCQWFEMPWRSCDVTVMSSARSCAASARWL